MSAARRASAFLTEVFSKWSEDRALTHGAALAYYTFFSLAPLLVLAIAIAGLVFGRQAAQGEIVSQIQGVVGEDGARTLEAMILRASQPRAGATATVVSLATMLFGASGVFGQLQSSLNEIWDAPTRRDTGSAVGNLVRRRLLAFAMILAIGSLLLLSLAVSALLAGLHDAIDEYAPRAAEALPLVDFGVSLAVVIVLFAVLFKLLPDVQQRWSDVWVGATVTAVLFTLGKVLIGLYLGRASATSIYGAAGSLVLVLLWIYYSAQILFLGAEFTEVWARSFGSRRGQPGAASGADAPEGQAQP